MSDNARHYRSAVSGFGAVVAQGPSTAWDAPSPCDGWSARDVAGHVIAVQHAILATIEGRPAPMNPMKEPGRHAGDDPRAAFDVAQRGMEAALNDPGVLERTVTTWRGEITVDELLGYNVGDTTVHTWDLARALGVDDTLDRELVDAALALYEPIVDTLRGPRNLGASVDVDPGADAQTRLLALVGRRRR